ncbi:hypothetical protein GBA52_015346 [Prunus armeniaca]|nr:hypothetical protein GBA52_015346 [Prunus armeniaca]
MAPGDGAKAQGQFSSTESSTPREGKQHKNVEDKAPFKDMGINFAFISWSGPGKTLLSSPP